MKQDKRFQKFFEDVSSILVEHKNKIKGVYVTADGNGFHVLLHKEIKINKWDIPIPNNYLDNVIEIKFSDYQFRLDNDYIDSRAIIYWFVQEM